MTDALYHDRIMALAREATGAGRLDAPDGTATLDNPLCGDRVTMDVTLAGGRITGFAHKVRGCALCQAGAAILGALAPGAAPEDIAALRAQVEAVLAGAAASAPLDVFVPVHGHRSRHECVRLPFQAAAAALEAARNPKAP
jgi:nitrogen fixation protein NifU and related proteins